MKEQSLTYFTFDLQGIGNKGKIGLIDTRSGVIPVQVFYIFSQNLGFYVLFL